MDKNKAFSTIYFNWANDHDTDSDNPLLASDVELEWFGQNITGRRDVANFIHANIIHQFNKIISMSDICQTIDPHQSEHDPRITATNNRYCQCNPEQSTSSANSLLTDSFQSESISNMSISSMNSFQSELDKSINSRSSTDQYQNQLVPCTSPTVKDGMFLHKVYSSSKSEENNITTGNFVSYVKEFSTMANLPTHNSDSYDADNSSSSLDPYRSDPRSTRMKTARKRTSDESDDSRENSLPKKKIRLEEKIESHIEDINRQSNEEDRLNIIKTRMFKCIECTGNFILKIPVKDPCCSKDLDVEILSKPYRLQIVYCEVTDYESTEEFIQEPEIELCEKLEEELPQELLNEPPTSTEKRGSILKRSEARMQKELIESIMKKQISRKGKAYTQEKVLATDYHRFRIYQIIYEEIHLKTKEEEHNTKLEKKVSTEPEMTDKSTEE